VLERRVLKTSFQNVAVFFCLTLIPSIRESIVARIVGRLTLGSFHDFFRVSDLRTS